MSDLVPMNDFPDYVDSRPNICGREDEIEAAIAAAVEEEIFRPQSKINFARIKAAFGIALYMHQPLIPVNGNDVISHLAELLDSDITENSYNANKLLECYRRMGDIIPEMLDYGKAPRVMLGCSGTLLYGLRRMRQHEVIGALKRITCEHTLRHAVEWLGCPWGHALITSLPKGDYRLHVRAWQHHFAAIFGDEALGRVRGFLPPHMVIPNHPDVAYEFVKTLKDCGYQWILVQEHTVERPESGWGPERKNLPHRLVCRNSYGDEAGIVAIIKTQGPDVKLVGHMKPYAEAKRLERLELAGKSVPQFVTQVADVEPVNVMMNEFPRHYKEVVGDCSSTETPIMNISEYLEHLSSMGIERGAFPELQPLFQLKVWQKMQPGDGREKLNAVIQECKKEDHRFHMDGCGFNDSPRFSRNEDIVGAIENLSARFQEKVFSNKDITKNNSSYREILFYLLAAETSDYMHRSKRFRDYSLEMIRRANERIHALPDLRETIMA